MPNKLTPVIISTIVIIVISLTPVLNIVNIFCCSGVVMGGVLGTIYYNNQLRKAESEIKFKDAFMIGLLSGILSAVIVVLISTIITLTLNQNPVPDFYRLIDEGGFQIPPQAEEFLKKVSDEYSRNGFSITLTLISLAFDLIAYPLFSVIGALLTVSVLTRKKT